jgi:hypothetical protein
LEAGGLCGRDALGYNALQVFWRYLRAASAFWLALTACAACLVLMAGAALALMEGRERSRQSLPATATVTGKRVSENVFGIPVFVVEFRYQDRLARQREGYRRVAAGEFEGYQPGQPLPVRVSATGDLAEAPDSGWTRYGWAAAACGLVGFAVSAAVLCRQWRAIRARVLSLRCGQQATGVVSRIAGGGRLAGGARFRIHWAWYGPDGEAHERSSPPVNPRRAGRWRPGDRIDIFLHPTDPDCAEADVFGFRGPLP